MLTTLLIVVTAVGGPLSAQQKRAPDAPMPGSLIEVLQPGTGLEATSRFGSLQLHLEQGTYEVTARVAPGGRPCGKKTVRLGRHGARVHLFCSIR